MCPEELRREQAGERGISPTTFFCLLKSSFSWKYFFFFLKNAGLQYEEERLLFMLMHILSCLEKFIVTFPEVWIIHKYLVIEQRTRSLLSLFFCSPLQISVEYSIMYKCKHPNHFWRSGCQILGWTQFSWLTRWCWSSSLIWANR